MENIKSLESKKPMRRPLLFIVTVLIILFETMPVFQGYFGAYPELLLIIAAFVLLFPMKRETFDKILLTLSVVLLFLILQSFTRINVDSFITIAYNIFKSCFVMILPVYLVSEGEEDMIKKLFWVIIVAITITEITTLINVDPNSQDSRMMITGLLSDSEQVGFARLNIGGFNIAYLSPVITTVLFALYKNKKLHLLLLLAHVLLTIMFIVRIQFTMALLIYFVALVALFLSDGVPKRIVTIVILALCLIPLLLIPLRELFYFLADEIESDLLSERFKELARFMSGSFDSDSDISIRLKAYQRSLTNFGANFIGGGVFTGAKNGGHSGILDYLAVNGLLGVAFLVFAFRSVYAKTINLYSKINSFGLIIFAQVLFFVFALVNPAFTSSPLLYLFLLSTGACSLIKKEEKTDEGSMAMQHPYPGSGTPTKYFNL